MDDQKPHVQRESIQNWLNSVSDDMVFELDPLDATASSKPATERSDTHDWPAASSPTSVPRLPTFPDGEINDLSETLQGSSLEPQQNRPGSSDYRDNTLTANGILMCSPETQLPDDVTILLTSIWRDRECPAPSPGEVDMDCTLHILTHGATARDVEWCFWHSNFLTPSRPDVAKSRKGMSVGLKMIPSVPQARSRVSTPKPDLTYGYDGKAFHREQRSKLLDAGIATIDELMYPFLLVEIKGDGPESGGGGGGGGSLWAATNECLGSSATCVNMVEHLNNRLRSSSVQTVESAVFSIAMSGTEARLYVTWKSDEGHFRMVLLRGFLLYDPAHLKEFRSSVWNIVDWGRKTRLNGIRAALDKMPKEEPKSFYMPRSC